MTALGRPNLLVSPKGTTRQEEALAEQSVAAPRNLDRKLVAYGYNVECKLSITFAYFFCIFSQMQLSEVIIRARRYYQQVSGHEGFVHEGKVDKHAFESRFKEKNLYEGNPEVQEWLSNMTFDKKG